jgi:hypothetical protein
VQPSFVLLSEVDCVCALWIESVVHSFNVVYSSEKCWSMINGSLSSQHCVSSGCGWRNSLQVWKVAANVLNKQSWGADKGWSSSLGIWQGANKS